MRDDADVRDVEMVEQSDDVGAERSAALAVDVVAAAEGAGVEGDAGVALREERYLLPPDQVVAALP